jgi:hypothetical protein
VSLAQSFEPASQESVGQPLLVREVGDDDLGRRSDEIRHAPHADRVGSGLRQQLLRGVQQRLALTVLRLGAQGSQV